MQKEIWRYIPGHTGVYQISTWGRIVKVSTGVETPITPSKDGRVGLTRNGVRKFYGVNRLVAMAFLGLHPEDEDSIVKHLNGDKNDNRVNNLKIVKK